MKRLRKEYSEIERLIEEHLTSEQRSNGVQPNEQSLLKTAFTNQHALPFRVFPLEDNFLEWHFTLLGPADSAFAGGLYHGRLQFQPDYPFTPPNLYFTTPNGRFEVNTKICLTVTGFHPEAWQPAWGVRTMLIAIREHFLVSDSASVGSIVLSDRERKLLAVKSQAVSCKRCGYAAPLSTDQVNRMLGQ